MTSRAGAPAPDHRAAHTIAQRKSSAKAAEAQEGSRLEAVHEARDEVIEQWEFEEGNIQYEIWGLGSFLKSLISISRDPCHIVGLRFLLPEAGLARRIVVRWGRSRGTALRHRADSGPTGHAGEISTGMPCGQNVGDSFGVLLYVAKGGLCSRITGGADVGLTPRAISDPKDFQNTGQTSRPQGDGTFRRAPGPGHSAGLLDEPAAPWDEMHARASPSQPRRMRGRGAVVGRRLLGSYSGGGFVAEHPRAFDVPLDWQLYIQ